MPTIQQVRDNLNIGLYLSNTGGALLEDILRVALGYIPDQMPPIETFDRRLREAQRVGRDAHRSRTPGYFTFNAMPFGGTYIYKATWYIWINPESGLAQIVPLLTGDLARMKNLRDKDLNTRKGTARSVRTADNVERQRRAVESQDWQAIQAILARMSEDESLGEILSGWYGLPYADIQEIIPQLADDQGMFQFQRNASRVRNLQRRLKAEQAQLSEQLNSWVMLQTGVPPDAPQLALQQARRRLAELSEI